jgi:hypothetical protein
MFESIHHPKKNTTMVKPNAGSSGMAIVINSCPPQEPLCDGLVEGTYEGFYSIV